MQPRGPPGRGQAPEGRGRRRGFGGSGAAVDAHPLDAAGVGVEDLELVAAGRRDQLAAHRDAADQAEDQPADGVDVLAVLAGGEIGADGGGQFVEVGAGVGEEAAVAVGNDRRARLLVVLVLDVADDHLDGVLHRHQAVGAAVLVDDQRHLHAARLHVGKERGNRHRGRHEQDVAHEIGAGERAATDRRGRGQGRRRHRHRRRSAARLACSVT